MCLYIGTFEPKDLRFNKDGWAPVWKTVSAFGGNKVRSVIFNKSWKPGLNMPAYPKFNPDKALARHHKKLMTMSDAMMDRNCRMDKYTVHGNALHFRVMPKTTRKIIGQGPPDRIFMKMWVHRDDVIAMGERKTVWADPWLNQGSTCWIRSGTAVGLWLERKEYERVLELGRKHGLGQSD